MRCRLFLRDKMNDPERIPDAVHIISIFESSGALGPVPILNADATLFQTECRPPFRSSVSEPFPVHGNGGFTEGETNEHV